MPKVRLLQSVAGQDFSWEEGDVVDMSPAQAKVWADGLRGELVKDTRERTTSRDPIETRGY